MGYELCEIGKIAKIVSGSTPSRNEQRYWNGNIKWITPKELSGNKKKYIYDTFEKITEIGFNSCSTQILPVNAVLLTSRAPIGLLAINKVELCTNQGFKSLIPKRDKLNESYLYYWLKNNTKYLNSIGNGATFKELSRERLSNVKIPLPPLQEQKRIARVLDLAQELIDQRKAAIADLEKLPQSLFMEMFGDPVKNPMGWEVVELKDVCKKITDGTHHSPPLVNNGIPYITARHVKNFYIDFYKSPTYININDHKQIYSRCSPEYGDVLYIKDGATTGIAAINKYDFPFSMLSSLALLKINKNLLTSEYLVHWLNNNIVKQVFIKKMSGAAIKRFTLSKIKRFHINIPDIHLQKVFSNKIEIIDKNVIYMQSQLKDLEDNFQALLQKAFKGELVFNNETFRKLEEMK